jgi:hypothetical protein
VRCLYTESWISNTGVICVDDGDVMNEVRYGGSFAEQQSPRCWYVRKYLPKQHADGYGCYDQWLIADEVKMDGIYSKGCLADFDDAFVCNFRLQAR